MKINKLFHLILIIQHIFASSALSRREQRASTIGETKTIKVLATQFPPFTYYDTDRGFFGGIDLSLLRTISNRLNYQLVIDKADDFNRIPMEKIE